MATIRVFREPSIRLPDQPSPSGSLREKISEEPAKEESQKKKIKIVLKNTDESLTPPKQIIKMDRKAIVTKAGDFWNSCKKCSKNCLCFCGLKDPKRVAIVSAAVIGIGIIIYRGWYKEIPSVAKSVVEAPIKIVRGGKRN